uniref:Myb/SANT-like DNA-binding domain-containing protein n=1 Tax=Iconisemion striatum TaxID=60296 RepID=A0A1A7XPI0_9TELE
MFEQAIEEKIVKTMEQPDHSYISCSFEQINSTEFTYKMSDKEIEDFVKLRMSNDHLFTGRKNSSKWAWRAILKHMGLHFKMSHRQASKKWDNMKKKHKELKYPPNGVKVVSQWPYFHVMDDAMEGRLQNAAPVLEGLPDSTNNSDFLPISAPKRKKGFKEGVSSPAVLVTSEPEMEVSLDGDEDEEDAETLEDFIEIEHIKEKTEIGKNNEPQMTRRDSIQMQRQGAMMDREVAALDRERSLLERERVMMEREKVTVEKERAVRERELMEREKAVLEREKGVMEREKGVMERERAVMEREKGVMERERAVMEREKGVMERERAVMEREKLMMEKDRDTLSREHPDQDKDKKQDG